MRETFPAGWGMDAGLTKLQILGVQEAILLGPGVRCVNVCVGINAGKIGWGRVVETFTCQVYTI